MTNVSVPYSVHASSTATGGGVDYTLASGTLNWTAGDSTPKTISISVTDDALDEYDETIVIVLGSPTGAALGGTTTHTYTILDNDNPPDVYFASTTSTVAENAGATTITIQLSAASGKNITVPFSIGVGSTASGSDYSLSSSPVTIPAGTTSTTITLTPNNDSLYELSETVVIDLGTPTNANLGSPTTHVVTITDDDPMPTVQFASTSSNGSESTTSVTVTVNLSSASGKTITVPFSVNASSTATGSGTDYSVSTSSPLTFSPGDTSKTISITINNDTLDENDETIILDLGSPTNADLGTNTTHTYTINDNDDPPTVQFASGSSNSTNEATGNRTIQLTLSTVSGRTVSVVVTDLLTGSATQGVDYTSIATSVVFNPGDTTANLIVAVQDDNLYEGNETINLQISSPTNATLGTQTTHTFTIVYHH